MLKISITRKIEGAWLQVEGSLTGSWVEELRQAAEEALEKSSSVTLDLERLRYLDLEGAALLRALAARRVLLVNASLFISRQLQISD